MPEDRSKCFGNSIFGITGKRLRHGEIGKGMNDYDAIFSELKSKGFDSWISIEDGVDGMEQLHLSVEFLKKKIAQHWPGQNMPS